MKLLELDATMPLKGLKVKTPDGKVGYIKSIWCKGVWLSNGETNRIYPQFVENLCELYNWELAEKDELVNL